MRRVILHLSDLHFGRDDPDLAPPLLATVARLAPDLVAISGDLTQRARPAQFEAARAFIDRIAAPVLVVPGNHDVPLDNPWQRLVSPFARYRRHISPDLEPEFRDAAMTVLGVNTVAPRRWQRGRMGAARLGRLTEALRAACTPFRIVVAHHPFEHPPASDKQPMIGAREALEAVGSAGADLILTGHLHSWFAAPAAGRNRAVQIHAGTGLSTRLRGEENDFARIELDGETIVAERWCHVGAGGFACCARRVFLRVDGRWRSRSPGTEPALETRRVIPGRGI